MKKEELDRLLSLAERWEMFPGPLRELDFEAEMQQEVEKLGAAAATDLSRLLAESTHARFEFLRTLLIFCGEYFDHYPQEMTEALLGELRAPDPYPIVDLLGDSRVPGVAKRIIEGVRLDFTNHKLISVLVRALGRLGDADARTFLEHLPRAQLTPALDAELDQVLVSMAKKPFLRD